jgi:hypothetical protein
MCLWICLMFWWRSLDSMDTESMCFAVTYLSSPFLRDLIVQRAKLVLLVWPSRKSKSCFLLGYFTYLEKITFPTIRV